MSQQNIPSGSKTVLASLAQPTKFSLTYNGPVGGKKTTVEVFIDDAKKTKLTQSGQKAVLVHRFTNLVRN